MASAKQTKAAQKQSAGTKKKSNKDELTPKQQRFVDEYLTDQNGKQAAIRAGYSPATAEVQASRLLSYAKVAAAVKRGQEKIAKKLEVSAEDIARRWLDTVTADPNEVVQFRRENCRYCHGIGHNYQWIDEAEHANACIEMKGKDGKPAELPTAGGFGFLRTREPNPDCPHCGGDGHGRVFINDTRKLSAQGLLLYEGVKQTKDGIEVKLADRNQAAVNLAKHLGMFKETMELTGKNGGPIETKTKVVVVPAKNSAVVEKRQLTEGEQQ